MSVKAAKPAAESAMVATMPPWKKPSCWVSSGRKGRAITQRPGATSVSSAPRWAMAPWAAKLARVRAS
jgi:hypothetical protein